MSDAFNNFCISCDQLCPQNLAYCSDKCRLNDETSTQNIIASTDIVSPLLTPSLYNNNQHTPEIMDLSTSPLLLPTKISEDDVKEFKLNYLVSQPLLLIPLALTSHNYRLWLTGVL